MISPLTHLPLAHLARPFPTSHMQLIKQQHATKVLNSRRDLREWQLAHLTTVATIEKVRAHTHSKLVAVSQHAISSPFARAAAIRSADARRAASCSICAGSWPFPFDGDPRERGSTGAGSCAR